MHSLLHVMYQYVMIACIFIGFQLFLNFFTDLDYLLKCFNVWRQSIKLQWQNIAHMRGETFGRMKLQEYSLVNFNGVSMLR